MVKVQHASESYITFIFLYKNYIWSSLQIFFIITDRQDFLVGSVQTNFQSLRGDRALTKVKFNQPISDYDTSVGRVFLNGFSSNYMKNLQLGISQSTINQMEMLINVITGPGFDLKQIWCSFIIFSPNMVPFASYGRVYQQIHFKGKKAIDSSGNIYSTQYRFLGFTLLSFLNIDDQIKIKAQLDEQFILQIQAQSFIDKFSVSYIIFGRNTGQVCEKCQGNFPYFDKCVKNCQIGSYQYVYQDNSIACRQCSKKINQKINNNSTGCQCNVDSQLKSGICQKRKIQPIQVQEYIKKIQNTQKIINRGYLNPQQQLLQRYQIKKLPLKPEQPQKPKCYNIQNSYWTGFRCACKTGYLPLHGGCQSFAQYVSSLSYSSTLYPTQFSYLPSQTLIQQNPCRVEQLRINGSCICKDKYYRNQQGLCIECQPLSTYSAILGQCVCNKGYKLNLYNKVCQVACPYQMSLNIYGQCVCPPGKGLMGSYCIPCNPENGGYILNNICYYCRGDLRYNGVKCSCGIGEINIAETCLKCDKYQTVYDNVCQCFQPYQRNPYTYLCQPKCTSYQVKIYGKCINCPINSFNNGSNVCVCQDGYQYQYNQRMCIRKNILVCQIGTYQRNNICIRCHLGCLSCASANFCNYCDPNGYRVIAGRCYETCGDGRIVGRQTCDDGNVYNNDGCSSTCSQEAGYRCYGRPSFCRSICGNGIITRYQQCDDRNKRGGDGCSAYCQIQPGSICRGQPSICWY